jgi:nucleoredoxin
MKRIAFLAVLLVFLPTLALADSPATLALSDLANRPDRWPDTVSISGDMSFPNGAVVHPTDKLRVQKFDGNQLVLIAPQNFLFAVRPQDCNFLDAANQAWSALTPAQRAIDATSLAADETLWPAQVTVEQPIKCQWGAMAAGTKVVLYGVNASNITIDWPNSNNRLNIDASMTDLILQARQLALLDPDKRPSRIAAALDGILVDSDGKPVHDPTLQNKKYFAFYSGAGWCPPCQAFSPDLVKYATATLPNHPELAFVMFNLDKTTPDMLAYMKQEQMPFPAVAMKDFTNCALLGFYSTEIIPDIVVCDRFGRIVATNILDAQGTRGDPEDTLKALDKILNQPAAQ